VRTVGREQAARGGQCRVIAVAPGVVETAMQAEIRATAARDFPAVGQFVEIFERGDLRTPAVAAQEIWQLVQDESVENGAVRDLRR
jgi:benzil reductase ((S)-benzoin forming)